MSRDRTISTTTKTTIRLTSADIVEALIVNGQLTPPEAECAVVTFRVPGGGDWANQTIEITAEDPIIVTVETTENT